MRELRGRVALVTGGSRGVGPHIARALAREGMNVAVTARTAGPLRETADELRLLGVGAAAVVGDLTSADDRRRIVSETEAALGPIDILVNNAGVVSFVEFSAQDEDDMRRILETNVVAPAALARAVLPGMLARGRGHIVTIGSMAGKKGIAYEAVYAGTKAAVIEWTGALRMELERTPVGASVILPVYVADTGMFAVHGIPAPWLAGSISAGRVASAVVRAIRHDLQEVIVRPTPTRPLLALNALSPALGTLIVKAMGVVAVNRRLARIDDGAPAAKEKPAQG